GGGGSGVNYIADSEKAFDFETDITGWNTYDDGASATPVDGTGGTPSTLTLSRNTTTPLRKTGDLKVAKSAADSQGEGFSIDVDVPRGSQVGQASQISFDMDTTHANYVAGDIILEVRDLTNGSNIKPTLISLP